MNLSIFRGDSKFSLTSLEEVHLDFKRNVYTVKGQRDGISITEHGELSELYEDKNTIPEFLFGTVEDQNKNNVNAASVSIASGPGNLTDPTTIPTMGSAAGNKDMTLDKLPVPGTVKSPENPTPGSITDSGRTGPHDKPSTEKQLSNNSSTTESTEKKSGVPEKTTDTKKK